MLTDIDISVIGRVALTFAILFGIGFAAVSAAIGFSIIALTIGAMNGG